MGRCKPTRLPESEDGKIDSGGVGSAKSKSGESGLNLRIKHIPNRI